MVAQILFDRQRRCRPRPRRYWVRPWLSRRLDYGHYDRLMKQLEAEDVVSFRNFVMMDPVMFSEVLQRVGPRIEKYDTWYKKSINPGCRPAITLRFLATGGKYRCRMFGFRVAKSKSCSVPIPVMPGSWTWLMKPFSARGLLDEERIFNCLVPEGWWRMPLAS